jgi:Ras-related protein Rab-7A
VRRGSRQGTSAADAPSQQRQTPLPLQYTSVTLRVCVCCHNTPLLVDIPTKGPKTKTELGRSTAFAFFKMSSNKKCVVLHLAVRSLRLALSNAAPQALPRAHANVLVIDVSLTPPPLSPPPPPKLNLRLPTRPFRSLQKIVILGAQGVGKTSLMERFVAAKFNAQYKATIGADFSTKDVSIGSEVVTLQIWDTAGQERYQSLGTAFYRGADACVLVYDVSEAASFAKLETWRNTFIQSADIKDAKDFPFVVLGNKSDMEQAKQVVLPGAVQEWCAKMGNIPNFQVRLLARAPRLRLAPPPLPPPPLPVSRAPGARPANSSPPLPSSLPPALYRPFALRTTRR